MALSRITWQDVQQMPDDGRRRFSDRLPVRLAEKTVGEIQLDQIFGRP